MLNKKAVIFHLIFFAFIAALGIFFLLISDVDTKVKIKGEWQLDFIENYVVEAENKLLAYEIEAQDAALRTALNLAENGGYSNIHNSVCGTYDNYQLWNKESTFCFPNIEESLNKTFPTYFGLDNFTFTYEGEEFIGESEEPLDISIHGELQDNVLEEFSFEYLSCLEPGDAFPVLHDSGELDVCHQCTEEDTCNLLYTDQFSCDLDPCNLNCLTSFYNEDQFSNCDECDSAESCTNYNTQYYCTLDPCKYGCVWNVNVCEDSVWESNSWDSNIFEKMTIVSNPDVLSTKTKYEVPIAFRTDINYQFAEYETLQTDTFILLNLCRNAQDLEDCLEKNRKDYWKFTDCDKDDYENSDRKVKFCINSPNNAQLFFLDGTLIPVQYLLALDFYPTMALPIEEIDVDYDGTLDAYFIYFNGDSLADKYNVYVTDYYNAESYSGSVEDLESYYLLNSNTFDNIEIDIINLEESCPSTKELSQFYYCPTYSYEYAYVLPADQYSDDDYFFTVTVEYNNQESEVTQFIQLN
jgi:hypothetical protein